MECSGVCMCTHSGLGVCSHVICKHSIVWVDMHNKCICLCHYIWEHQKLYSIYNDETDSIIESTVVMLGDWSLH